MLCSPGVPNSFSVLAHIWFAKTPEAGPRVVYVFRFCNGGAPFGKLLNDLNQVVMWVLTKKQAQKRKKV
jgi:hypothetical protein